MLRITAGNFKNRVIKIPSTFVIRPTVAKVREAIFAILGNRILYAKIIDLFAGSGIIGLEALSRGAAECLFVEKSTRILKILKKNLSTFNFDIQPKILQLDLTSSIASKRLIKYGPFQLIFADPPYDCNLSTIVIYLVAKAKLLNPTGILVIEHSRRERIKIPSNLVLSDQRLYGQTKISFFKVNCCKEGF